MKKKQSTALVEVLEPTTTDAFAKAKLAVSSLPTVRFPDIIRKTDQFEQANDMLRQVATADKLVENERKSVTKHLSAATKAVNLLFKPLKEKLTDMRGGLEDLLTEYDQWTEQEQEREREALRKKAEAAERRAQKKVEKDMYAARTREMRREIKEKAEAKSEARAAVLDSRLDAVDDVPDAAEGVARIEDVEVTELNLAEVPEYIDVEGEEIVLWTRQPVMSSIKKVIKDGVNVPGVTFERAVRRAVRSL